MGLQVALGKYYMSRAGRVFGPMEHNTLADPARNSDGSLSYPFKSGGYYFRSDGTGATGAHVLVSEIAGPKGGVVLPLLPPNDMHDALLYTVKIPGVAATAIKTTTADDECRRICTTLLNGHMNGCPFAKGIR